MGNLERNSETWKTLGFSMPGFKYWSGFNFRVRVGKRSGYSPGFQVFGFKDPSLINTTFLCSIDLESQIESYMNSILCGLGI